MIITGDFERAIEAVKEGRSVFITGKAGTGKSTLLRHLRGLYADRDLAVVAPTGVAALNVDGRTIHDFFGFRAELTADLRAYRSPNRLKTIEMLVIDEVSMVKAPLMDQMSLALSRAKKKRSPFGGIQTILIGDLYQLPPVQEHRSDDPEMEGYATPFFFSSQAFRQLDIDTIELKQVFRQKDASFIEMLNAIRDGTFRADHLKELNRRVHDLGLKVECDEDSDVVVTLASSNAYIDEYNNEKLSELPGKEHIFPATETGTNDARQAGKFAELKNLRLKVGAQVMLQVNQDGYVNGTMGTITRIAQDRISVAIPDLKSEVEVFRHTWESYETKRVDGQVEKELVGTFTQFPLKLAWAVTIHKSQGKTFKRVVYDCGRTFETGMAYVALSRVTSLEGLRLIQPVEDKHIKVHPSVIRFHKKSTISRSSLGDFPVAYVGSVATGADRYRKLVEFAVIRYENGKEKLRFSTLIQPERDASNAVMAGINAAELSLAPTLADAQPIIALALSGAVLVGTNTEEVLESLRFPTALVQEGVGIDFEIPSGRDSERLPGAMEIAENVADAFGKLAENVKQKYRVVPFESAGWKPDTTSYIFSRDRNSPMKQFYEYASGYREQPWTTDLVKGYAVGLISRPDSPLADTAQGIAHLIDKNDSDCPANILLERAKEDRIVTQFEKEFLERLEKVFRLDLEDLSVGDFREKVSLSPGMRVYVSGGPGKSGSSLEGLQKAEIKKMCKDSGLIFESKFLKKTGIEVLALADLSNVKGGSFEKARKWQVPAISWEELVAWATSQERHS